MNCIACGQPIDGAYLRLVWEGFTATRSLNGTSMPAHFTCVQIGFPESAAPMLPRIPDPDPLVHVGPEYESGEWVAYCMVHGVVAQKEVRDDAHLVAALHIARVHSGLEVSA